MAWHDYTQPLFNLTLTTAQIAQFDAYREALLAWNEHTNLTAITLPEEVNIRHFLDSLSVVLAIPSLPHLPPNTRLIDVGTGAGFPGLALAITFPNLHVTLLEATGKKITFLTHVIEALGLTNARVAYARAEEAGQDETHRGQYAVVVARAVARLPGLLEYMLPLAHMGGRCVAMKGITAQDEAHDSKRALKILGGQFIAIHRIELPTVNDPHALVVVDKIASTPRLYPRKPGVPTRNPL